MFTITPMRRNSGLFPPNALGIEKVGGEIELYDNRRKPRYLPAAFMPSPKLWTKLIIRALLQNF
jgi:hypothetical protein